MDRPRVHTHRIPAPHGGFTIIELMVVVLIIGILVALLFPAISGAIRNAREAQVVVEMKNFEKGIVDFKNRFGVEIPSFLVLYEAGEGQPTPSWGTDTTSTLPGTQDAYRRTSRAFIRQCWPEFDFAYTTAGGAIDLNADGDTSDVLILNGTECLVFFLGGVRTPPILPAPPSPLDELAPIGFAADPRNPFDATGSNNRIGPFYTFDASRFTDIDAMPDRMPEYMDPLPGQTRPYVFLSGYEGRGYQPFGSNASIVDDEVIPNGTAPALSLGAYFKDAALMVPWNPQTYQIISPGGDGDYGTGGDYNNENVSSARSAERDNITNFKGGRLN